VVTRAVEDSLDGVGKPLRQGIGAAAGRAGDDELIRARGQRMGRLDVHLLLDVGPSGAGLLRIAGRGGAALPADRALYCFVDGTGRPMTLE
jgi:hypothetical protein